MSDMLATVRLTVSLQHKQKCEKCVYIQSHSPPSLSQQMMVRNRLFQFISLRSVLLLGMYSSPHTIDMSSNCVEMVLAKHVSLTSFVEFVVIVSPSLFLLTGVDAPSINASVWSLLSTKC